MRDFVAGAYTSACLSYMASCANRAASPASIVRRDKAPRCGFILPGHIAEEEPQDVGVTASPVVLLVEDEAGLREGMAEWLRDAGYRVLEAADGAAALRLLHSGGRVNILVTDVGLPGSMNGRQVADAARLERPDLPILFITGYAGMALQTALPDDMAIIDKPFVLDELTARVRNMLQAAAPPK